MNYFMLRSFDHAGYYETRLILMVIGLVVACWFALRRRDYRYAVMFACGLIFQGLMEYRLQSSGMRGTSYNLSVFGYALPSFLGILFQGCVEGGILSLMAFWFTDLHVDSDRNRQDRKVFWMICGLIVVLAAFVGLMAAGRPISSPRPMFSRSSTFNIGAYVILSIIVCAFRGGLRYLGYFYLGLLLYVFLTFETLHIFGARFIGVRGADGQFAHAAMPWQILIMVVSHFWEVAGAKLHYFAAPFLLGLVKFNSARKR